MSKMKYATKKVVDMVKHKEDEESGAEQENEQNKQPESTAYNMHLGLTHPAALKLADAIKNNQPKTKRIDVLALAPEPPPTRIS